jgi:hypothetical protein
MRNHYLPQSYLRGFAESGNSDFIFRYEKNSDNVIRTNLINVGQENKLYPDELETFLANEYDSPGKIVLDAISNHKKLTEDQKSFFADYILLLIQRVPETKTYTEKWFATIKDEYLDNLENELKTAIAESPDKLIIGQRRIEELHTIREKNKINPTDIWHQLIKLENFPLMRWALQNMNWQFMTTRYDEFVTCDNPVFIHKAIGLNKSHSELYFPICRRIGLWMTWQGKEGYSDTNQQFVNEMNRRMVQNATKYIFFCKERSVIMKLANNPSIRLNYLLPSTGKELHFFPADKAPKPQTKEG